MKRNVVANFVGKGWSALMNIALAPAYIKLIGIEAYGLVGFSLTLQSLFSLLDMGLSATMNREMARYSAEPDKAHEARTLVRTLEWIYWPIALLIVLSITLLAPFLATHWLHSTHLSSRTVQQCIVMMGIFIAFQWPYSFYENGLLGMQKQVQLNAISTTIATLRGLGAILLLVNVAPTPQVYFFWQIVVSAVMTSAVCLCLWRQLPAAEPRPHFQVDALRGVWKYAVGMMGISVLALILMTMDKIILSRLLTLEALGYYTLAYSVAGVLYNIVIPFVLALFPRLVQMIAREETEERLAAEYHRGCQIVSVVLLPAAGLLALYSREVMLLWTHLTHQSNLVSHTHTLISILVIGTACNALINFPATLQMAFGWTKLILYQNLISVLLLAPLLFWLTKQYGATGASLSWMLLNVGYVLIMVPLMHRRLLRGEQWRWYGQDVGLPLLAVLLVEIPGRVWLGKTAPASWLTLIQLTFIWLAALLAAAFAAPQARLLLRQRFAPRKSLEYQVSK